MSSLAPISATSVSCRWRICSARMSFSRSMRACSMACSWAIRARWTSSWVRISAFSTASRRSISNSVVSRSVAMRDCCASASRATCSRTMAVRCSARIASSSRSWSSRELSLSRSICSVSFSASRLRERIATIEVCSMSLRALRRVSISSMSRVSPSASKRFAGLKNSSMVWSRPVIATDSSSRPFGVSTSAARTPTSEMKSPRFSWISSRVIWVATERSALTNFPERRSASRSGSRVRRPRVDAAAATASRSWTTRTKNSASMSTRIRSRVMTASSRSRETAIRTTLRLTGVTWWMIGRTRAPPSMTTVSPPNPVRTKASSLVERW